MNTHCLWLKWNGDLNAKNFNGHLLKPRNEASLLDQIKMTKYRLEFDRIKMTTMNVNVGTWPKLYNNEH